MTNNRSAFTLVELLVVVLIISILSTVVGLSIQHMPGRARVAAAKAQLGTFKIALQSYQTEQGFFPSEQQGLDALCHQPTIPPVPGNYPEGGYLDSLNVPADPWGNNYTYFMPGRGGKSFEIVSFGKDGQPGGSGENADISSLEL